MKLQDSVSTISGSVKLPPSVTAYLEHNKDEFEDDDVVKGGILQDFKFAWLGNGSKFVVINVKTGHKIAAWTFGAVLRDFKTCVTCVCEIPPLIENTKQLLIGLECDMIGGLVCLFHCQGSRVLRAIRLDCRVSCMEFVERFPSGHLQCFDGTVIIGTHGGSVLAFDLNRQSCIEAIVHGKSGRENLIRDELNIANLFTLSLEDIALIEEQRSIACKKDDHIAIQMNEGCFRNLQYILYSPDNIVKLRATRERVFVTSLLYIPQLGCVVIGFNFGAFQLWNTVTLQLEYTSPVSTDHLPISHLGFLEPCDDPRAFSYLWVIYSSLDRHEEGFPLAAMYAFSYQNKTSMGDGVYLYENFISCNLRFNVELSSLDSVNVNVKQMVGGRSLACHTFTKTVGRNKDSEESVLNLCQIVWECWTISAITPVQSVMIIFDIDQWYKEQMPELTMLESNSFLSVVNLGETLSHTASCYLCDVRINNDSLSPYYSVPRLEEHYFPNSLGYECICLTNTDVTHLSTVGVQRQLLSSLNEIGPSVLLHPTKIFIQCITCGLIPLYMDPPPNPTTSIPIQRQTILSIALEARLICFLSDCARDWATGCHSSVGCSLTSFTQWAWCRSLTLKSNADQLTVPLFDHSGDGPDANSVSCLESCTRQLGHVAKLFHIMLDKCANLMLPEAIKELKQKHNAVQVVSLYFQVIQWFLNVGLLPEFSMKSRHILERTTDRLPYPLDSLVRYYQNRRVKLHCLNGENPSIENLQNKSCPLLFIDQFIKMECAEDKLKKFWLDDNSETKGLYPPPSLFSLLRTYLIPGILDENKHALVLYVLIDYAMTFDEARYESVIRRLMQFPTMFGLSNNVIKVTQAFWHLDHRDFELALDQLESVAGGGWLKQWQHNVALTSLLVQNKSQAALQYLYVRRPPHTPQDWETCCNLYLSRGLLLEAFNMTKDSLLSHDLKEQRMIMFLEGCKRMNLLSKALTLPLSNEEEIIVTNFLKALGDSDAHDLLIMYYLQRSRFIEAQHANDNLKRLTTKGQLPYDVSSDFCLKKDHIPKNKTRDELVDMYCKTLPKVTRSLAHLANQHVLPTRMCMPTPMTVNLQATSLKPVTYRSSVIQATIDKANETWLERPGVAKSLKRALQVEETPFICTPKMERHSSRLNDFEKMITTPEGMNISPSPAKKPRLSEDSCGVSPEDPKVRREVETLLHTPVVERKSRWRGASTSDTTREATPQSILKVRAKLLDGSSIDERHYAETDEEFDTASVNTQSDNLSRSIRFNIPSPGNTPSGSITPTDLNESFDELSGIQPFRQSSFTNQLSSSISARRSIHQSFKDEEEDIDKEMSPLPEISTPIKRTQLRGRKLISPTNSCDDNILEDINSAPAREYSNQNVNDPVNTLQNDQKVEVESNDDEDTVVFDKQMEEIKNESDRKVLTPNRSQNDKYKKGPQPRRSLRNTPEKQLTVETNTRVLRSRSRTPDRETSPVVKVSPSKNLTAQKTKKSLARIVLEANALSVVTKTEKITESFSQSTKESKSLQDVTFPADISSSTRYQSLVTSRLMESLCSKNESLLDSDISEIDSDVSCEPEHQDIGSITVDKDTTINEEKKNDVTNKIHVEEPLVPEGFMKEKSIVTNIPIIVEQSKAEEPFSVSMKDAETIVTITPLTKFEEIEPENNDDHIGTNLKDSESVKITPTIIIEEPDSIIVVEELVDDEHKESQIIEEPIDDEHKESQIIEEPIDDKHKESQIIEEPIDDEHKESQIIEEPIDDEHKESQIIEEPIDDEHKESQIIEEPIDDEDKESQIIEEPIDDEHKESRILEEPVVEGIVEEVVAESTQVDSTIKCQVEEGEPEVTNKICDVVETPKYVVTEPIIEQNIPIENIAEDIQSSTAVTTHIEQNNEESEEIINIDDVIVDEDSNSGGLVIDTNVSEIATDENIPESMDQQSDKSLLCSDSESEYEDDNEDQIFNQEDSNSQPSTKSNDDSESNTNSSSTPSLNPSQASSRDDNDNPIVEEVNLISSEEEDNEGITDEESSNSDSIFSKIEESEEENPVEKINETNKPHTANFVEIGEDLDKEIESDSQEDPFILKLSDDEVEIVNTNDNNEIKPLPSLFEEKPMQLYDHVNLGVVFENVDDGPSGSFEKNENKMPFAVPLNSIEIFDNKNKQNTEEISENIVVNVEDIQNNDITNRETQIDTEISVEEHCVDTPVDDNTEHRAETANIVDQTESQNEIVESVNVIEYIETKQHLIKNMEVGISVEHVENISYISETINLNKSTVPVQKTDKTEPVEYVEYTPSEIESSKLIETNKGKDDSNVQSVEESPIDIEINIQSEADIHPPTTAIEPLITNIEKTKQTEATEPPIKEIKNKEAIVADVDLDRSKTNKTLIETEPTCSTTEINYKTSDNNQKNIDMKEDISQSVPNKEISTPKRISRRRSSARSDTSVTLPSTLITNIEETKQTEAKKDLVETPIREIKNLEQNDEMIVADVDLDRSKTNKTLIEIEQTCSTTQIDSKTPDNNTKNIELKEDNSQSIANKEMSTPKRITRRRSSAQSDTSLTLPSTPDNKIDLDTSIARSTRSASKKKQQLLKDSDSPSSEKNISVVDDDKDSVYSNASSSKRSVKAESTSSSRKSRKSTLQVPKSNLSIIPEVSHVESDTSRFSKDGIYDSTFMEQFISSKRLTRHQRSMLEKSFDSTSGAVGATRKSRKTSGSDDVTDVEPQGVGKSLVEENINPIELMDRGDFTGKPDPSELSPLSSTSPSRSSSVVSEYTTNVPERSKRASSESVATSTETKKLRRLSVDMSVVLEESITESPGRARRKSFNKAIEALSTPKRSRRLSTDSKNDTDGASDTSMSDRMTPNVFKERISEMNQSKLLVIEEDEDGEGNVDKGEQAAPSTPKPLKQTRKAKSVQGYSTPDNKEIKKTRVRMSQLLTPLSKEEEQGLDDIEKPRYRRRTTMHKVIQPLEFVVKKK